MSSIFDEMSMLFSPRQSFFLVAASLAFVLMPLVAPAAVLVSYTFSGTNDAPTTTGANSTGGSLSLGAGIGLAQNGFNTSVGNPAPSRFITGDLANQASTGAQYTNNVYFEFTLAPQAGYHLNLSSATFDFGASFSTSLLIGWNLNSSVGGFTQVTAIASASFASSGQAANAFTQQTIDLSGAQFQNLSSAVTFRLYLSDSSSSAASQVRFDNLTVNGTAAIPEPAVTTMMGFGLVGLLGHRSIHRRNSGQRG